MLNTKKIIPYLIMSAATAIGTMLTRLGFSDRAAQYMARDGGLDSIDELVYLDDDDVENAVKKCVRPGGTITTGTGSTAVTAPDLGNPVSIRAEANLKLCVFYLRHRLRVGRTTTPAGVTLALVREWRDQMKFEAAFKVTATEPVINDKDWPRTLENIREFLSSVLGKTGVPLAYAIRTDVTPPAEGDDPAAGDAGSIYDTPDLEMIARAPHSGTAFRQDKRAIWDYMSNICGAHECWIYIKPAQRARDGRLAYQLLFNHYLGPNNVGNMASAAETKLASTMYNGEKKRFNWETYVRIHTEQHSVLNGLREYGYAGIDDNSKVRILMKGIKTNDLDAVKTQILASPALRDDFQATVELYATFIKQTKAENPQMNVSEVSYSKYKGKNSNGKRGSPGGNGDVDDRFYEKEEYHALSAEQKNTLRLKRAKRGHVGSAKKSGGGGGGGASKSNAGSKSSMRKMQHTIAALSTKIDELLLENGVEMEDEVETPNRSNKALTRQKKKD